MTLDTTLVPSLSSIRPWLQFSLLVGLALFIHLGGISVKTQTPVVVSRTQVTPPGSGPHFWWTLAVSADNPRLMIICALTNRSNYARPLNTVLYGSSDSGQSWRMLKEDSTYPGVSETSCAFGAGSTIYLTGSGSKEGVLPEWTHIHRSLDFGLKWEVSTLNHYLDAPVLLVNPGLGVSRDRLTIFSDAAEAVKGNRFGRWLTTSRDGGRTFTSRKLPNRIANSDELSPYIDMEDAIRIPGGRYGSLYFGNSTRTKQGYITFSRVYADGGSAGDPIVVARTESTKLSNLSGVYYDSPRPTMAAGRVPGTDTERLYVAWHDWVDGRIRILLTSSDDAGDTWTTPRVIGDNIDQQNDERDVSAYHPSLAVNADGVVGLMWAEFEGRAWRFATSSDGGGHFGASISLSRGPKQSLSASPPLSSYLKVVPAAPNTFSSTDRTNDSFTHVQLNLADWSLYQHLSRQRALVAAPDSTFLASWVQFGKADAGIYLSRIIIDRDSVMRSRRQLISNAVPVSKVSASGGKDNVWLDYTSLEYDEFSGEFVVGVVLAQRSGAKTLPWPLVLRVRKLASAIGEVSVVGADNDLPGEGAAWVLAGPARSLPRGSRAELNQSLNAGVDPYVSSMPRTLRMRLSEPRSVKLPERGSNLLDIDFEVLAAPRQPAAPKQ